MTPRCSCVVRSGILLTWDPLGRFFWRGGEKRTAVRGDVGVAKAQQDLAERKKGSMRRAQKYRRARVGGWGGGGI